MTETSADTTAPDDGTERSDAPPSPARTPRWRVDKTLLIAAIVVGLGLALVVRGLLISVTGDARAHLPDAVERVDPVPEATQVLSQTNVFVDLVPGYTGSLTIDGVALETAEMPPAEPGQQMSIPPTVVYEPGNATLTFTPSDVAAITEFDEGVHTVVLRFWKLDETEAAARTFTWTFNVV